MEKFKSVSLNLWILFLNECQNVHVTFISILRLVNLMSATRSMARTGLRMLDLTYYYLMYLYTKYR